MFQAINIQMLVCVFVGRKLHNFYLFFLFSSKNLSCLDTPIFKKKNAVIDSISFGLQFEKPVSCIYERVVNVLARPYIWRVQTIPCFIL